MNRASTGGSPGKSSRPRSKGGGSGQRPALVAGATAAALLGSIALGARRRARRSPTRFLGVPVPRTGGDVRSLVKQLGKASRQVGQTSKDAGKEIQRFGEQAEEIGKLLS